jgi:cyclic beta-1,2-glucan synthetase
VVATVLQGLVPEAPAALRQLLTGAQGGVLPPVRSEIFGPERFALHGQSLGLTHDAGPAGPLGAGFFPRLRSNILMLRRAHAYIAARADSGVDISPAAEWLLDNFHLIEAQLKAVHEGLPRSYFRSLPVLLSEPLAGLPRIYGVAWAFVAHTDSAFDEELLVRFLCAYQEARELNLAEMWALPTTLRVVLVENLRRLAERLATHKAARELANLCCDRIGQFGVVQLQALRDELAPRGVDTMFLAQMAQRLQDRVASTGALASPEVLAWLQSALPSAADVQAQQSADQTADNLSVSDAVTSLRAIGDADWPDIVSRTSPLMQRLLAWPLFAAEDTSTRDQTLHAIEQLARKSRCGELVVAQALLALMRNPPGSPHRLADSPQHWLLGAGRPALAQALGLREPLRQAWQRMAPGVALPIYLGALLLLTAGLVAALLPGTHAGPWWALLAALLMLGPATETVVALVNRLISESARPHRPPRLALAQGIPPEHRVLVVVPALLPNAAAVEPLLHRLRLHHLANPEPQAQFALLTDFADAATEHAEGDEPLLQAAIHQLARLNALHPGTGAAPRFILLHRPRRFSASEQRWIGWERKRGKLEQLVHSLATGERGEFMDLGSASQWVPATPYILTLDADTQLPPGRLRELVGVAAHPANTPVVDTGLRRVTAGHAILQPRMATPLPGLGESTLFHTLFAGQCGMDPYSAASSEVYQDVFGEGSFSGKGLLHVSALQAVLGGRMPDGQVLSHDLLEGSLARCAVVSDITLIEDAPVHADVAAARLHRWTRGDWQLLPLLLQPRRFAIAGIHRWKMLDNLRRSLVAPLSLATLLLALTGLGLLPGTALLLVLAGSAAGPVMGSVAGFAPSRDDIALRHFYAQAAADAARALWGGLWHAVMLLQQALAAGDAIVRALHRTWVSHRGLLQWTTAAAAQASSTTSVARLWAQHRLTPMVAGALALALLLAGTTWPWTALLLCTLWALSPLWTALVSRPWPPHEVRALPALDQAYLQGVARDTWRYFERCVTAEDHHLPPDNLQTTPHDMLAHRTSPTNIGLYLLAVACAQRFGFISVAELIARLQATLAGVAQLERHRGHLLNWYDTQTLAPLLPRYVSTVDSGNFSGHVLALAQACEELAAAAADEAEAATLRVLARQCEQLAWQPEFGFLYHRRRHLLHIGYRVAEQQLDAGFYDLLASESRLTSLLAIAKGDVPVRHWAVLGRPFFAAGAGAGLRSWSGSMFEYLMPTLVLDEPPGSVLREACVAALREQVRYARTQQVPWGISESAYAGCDHTLAYQYAPQGVPRLALRRTPPDELVVAPYASALALLVAPHRATLNLAQLQALGARGSLGFIEALDYTPALQADGRRCTPVNTFMAHHQGMTLVALAQLLLDGDRGGVVQRWGMASAQLQAVSSLLHERAPREVPVLNEPPGGPRPQPIVRRAPALLRQVLPGQQAVEPTQLLSNGRYRVALRANGAGSSQLGASALTRVRDDALRDALGSFFYVRGGAADKANSITQHPAPDATAHYRSVFHADRVCFEAIWPEMEAHMTVWVSPEDDVEFRQVELHNLGDEPLELELISAFEVTMAPPRADEAHPAFSGLFLQAHWQPAQQALVFERRPRLDHESPLHMAHFLAEHEATVLGLLGQTDRSRWLGRNRAVSDPLADLDALELEGADEVLNTGLDPACVLGVRLRIAPLGKAHLTFATAASSDALTLRALVDKYRQPSHVQRASLMSATLAGIRLRTLGLSAENLAAIQVLTTALVLGLTRPGPPPYGTPAQAPALCDRRLLWRLGLSGERPLLLVSAGAMHGIGLLRTLAQALRLWNWGGLACDLVVVNAEPASYLMALHREIGTLRDRYGADHGGEHAGSDCAFHLLRADDLSADDLTTLQALARVRLVADGRTLEHHVQEWVAMHDDAQELRAGRSTTALPHAPQATLPGSGSFAPLSGEFSFTAGGGLRPLRPWINVLANEGFGSQVSDGGGGCTWALNSRLHQLTAWSNDPVADPPAEWLLLQDVRTLQAWSATPSAWAAPGVAYRVSHGAGFTRITHERGDLLVELQWCVDLHLPVRHLRLRVHNRGTRTQILRAVAVAEWMLGERRADRHTVHTALHRQRLPDGKLTALLATQQECGAGFGGSTAWLACAGAAGHTSQGGEDWTCDRREFLDARGAPVLPDHLGQLQGSGLDPCAALGVRMDLPPGAHAEQIFLLGHSPSAEAARSDAARAAVVPAPQRLAEVRAFWSGLLGATQVQTPDPLFDALVNHWLVYQAVSCRLWAKAGFYQAGGATGFRDQLQDTLALAWAAPGLLRAQILRCASRQFVQGDVQHWWHEPGGAGVRTHFSDDLLWLPHALLHYLQATSDTALLNEMLPFLDSPPVPDGAEDLYGTPTVSDQQGSVYEHAARTLDLSLRVGAHGLPLMGSGDWNDGMNRVGSAGRGESVWLAWFLCPLVAGMAPLARARGDRARADRWEEAARGWRAALEHEAWDGAWYRRAFFDNGQPLGSATNPEARIDLIAQAWAVLSTAAPVPHQQQAMAAVREHLADPQTGLLRLLTPPLAQAEPSAGYIQAYPPGVRENGGQYTHGGVWALMAQAMLESAGHAPASDLPYQWFTWLSPAHRAASAAQGKVYGLEPYAVAGDVYSAAPHAGRGGWSWYTGAASWLHRAAVESIFGLKMDAATLSLQPALPAHWPRAEITLRRGERSLHFLLLRGASAEAAPPEATPLQPGEPIAWTQLPLRSRFVIRLPVR